MLRKSNRAMTIVELIVSMAICIPVIYIVWEGYLSGRKRETVTVAFAGAVKGATILESMIRKDLSLATASSEDPAVSITDDMCTLTIRQSIPVPTTEILSTSSAKGPFTVTKDVQYKLKSYKTVLNTDYYHILRNDRRIPMVVISDFRAAISGPSSEDPGGDWIVVDFTAYDEGLSKKQGKKGFYSFSNTILERIPPRLPMVNLPDYTQSIPVGSDDALCGWIEGIDDRYIRIGAFSGVTKERILPTIASEINGNNFPVIFPDRPENHIERNGTSPYLSMSFDYETALRLTGKSTYREELFNASLFVLDPDSKEPLQFFERELKAPAASDFDIQNIAVIHRYFESSTTTRGLHLFFTQKRQSPRPSYRLAYQTATTIRKISATNIGNGYFHAFLEDFPETGNIGHIQIESGFLKESFSRP